MNVQTKIKEDLKILSKNKIKFCMLKDYLKEKDYADIDILVSSKDRRKIHKILKSLSYDNYHQYTTSVFYHKLIETEVVRFHLHSNYFFEFLQIDKVNIDNTDVPMLAKEEYLVSLVKKVVSGRKKDKYMKEFDSVVKFVDKAKLKKVLCAAFKKSTIDYDAVIKKDFSKLKILKSVIKRKRQLKRSDWPSIVSLFFKMLFKPCEFVVFMGVDGSGKTTTVKKITEYLRKRKFRVFTEYGGRFKFQYLPLNKLVSNVATKKKKVEGQNQDVIKYESKFVHNVTPFIYYAEYFLRYMFSTFIKRRLNNFVFADRSFIDVIISPNTNNKIARFLYFILPKPSKIVYLYNDLEVLSK